MRDRFLQPLQLRPTRRLVLYLSYIVFTSLRHPTCHYLPNNYGPVALAFAGCWSPRAPCNGSIHGIRVITLLWLVPNATQVLADFNPTGGVTMTQVYTEGANGTGPAITFYSVICPGVDDLNLIAHSNYSAYATTAPPYAYGPNDFIDCDSCKFLKLRRKAALLMLLLRTITRSHPATTTGLPASGTAPTYRNGSTLNATITVPTSRTGPVTIASHINITPPIPFEEYWCSSYASAAQDSALLSFQNNGANRPQLHGLNPSAKTVCMSVEADNYSK